MYQILNKDNIFPKLLISLSECDAKMMNSLNLENVLGELFSLRFESSISFYAASAVVLVEYIPSVALPQCI